MRADQPSTTPLSRQLAASYGERWNEWSPLVLLAMNGDRSPERYAGIRQRHHDRLSMLHGTLGISMKIISRYSLDDPRIPWAELQERIARYRRSRDRMNPWKNKGGRNANK